MKAKVFRAFLVIIIVVLQSSCKMTNKTSFTDQRNEIKTILDSAMLCDDPLGKFNEVLPRIKDYKVVDSAWILDLGFYVKYKGGGTESWLLTPFDLKEQ